MSTPPLLEEIVERDLREIRRQLRGMSDLVIRALNDAVRALQTRDRRLAYTVILGDKRIDAVEGHVDRLCQEFLVRHMPVAAQLRFIIAATKVNSELERMGDYADAIAHRTVTLTHSGQLPLVDRMCEMALLSVESVRLATQAFVEGDVASANRAFEMEQQVDVANRALFDELSHPDTGERDLSTRFALVGILNRIERVADRACNIAEDAIYAAKGEVLRHATRGELRVLLLSTNDASLGPMAEAIARHRAPLRCGFTSAGLETSPLDPAMVAYVARRGLEISRQHPRLLSNVGSLEDFNVVVLLTREADDACPSLPYRTIALAWDVPDPAQAGGTSTDVEAAYARAYTDIDLKLGDLVAALLGDTPETPELT